MIRLSIETAFFGVISIWQALKCHWNLNSLVLRRMLCETYKCSCCLEIKKCLILKYPNPKTKALGAPDPSLYSSLNVTVYMHNQGDLELLTLWIVGKGGKCHKKNHHFDCSLYSIHSIDMTDLTIESNENREKRFAYLVLLYTLGISE